MATLPLKLASYIHNCLLNDGYVIIPDVLTKDEVETATSMFKQWQKSVPNLEFLHKTVDPHGIYKFHQAGHQRHAWYIRTRSAVQNVFAFLHNSEDLIVSYDGCCYIDKKDKRKDKCWTHTDQAPDYKGVWCFQGFVSLTANKERTLQVYKGSHLNHEEYFKEKGITGKKNWQLIDKEYLDNIENTRIKLDVPAGALVLWDSRVFHQNTYGKPESEERIVQYVCFYPRVHENNTAANQKKREKYFNEKRMTPHWPAPLRVNPLQPQTYGDESRIINYESLPEIDLNDMIEDILKIV
tara:strand:- start:1335 stop:2222 length:888 start_codon:yes stop_codon:yes gene_type:complete